MPPASTFSTLNWWQKRMQLLRELGPAAKRIALLTNPTDPLNDSVLRDVEAAAIGQQVLVFEAATPAARSMQPSRTWCVRKPKRCLLVETLTSTRGASNSSFWRRATGFPQSIRNALLSKPAG